MIPQREGATVGDGVALVVRGDFSVRPSRIVR